MIVVAGGSGVLGRYVVDELVTAGQDVRVLVRDAPRARAVLGERVETVAADVRSRDDVRRAVQGATVVVSAMHGFLGGRGAGPDEVDRAGNLNLVDAASAAGAGMVLVSVLPASPDSRVDLFHAKAAAERYLQSSGVPWTIVRAGPFLETWIAILTETAGTSGRPLIFGTGDQPLAFVSAQDVAAVVARAVTDESWRGQTLEVAGPPMTMNALAQALKEARGWDASPRHIPRPVLRALAILTRSLRPAFARQNLLALDMDTTPLPAGTPTSSPIGAPPRSLSRLLTEPAPSRPGQDLR